MRRVFKARRVTRAMLERRVFKARKATRAILEKVVLLNANGIGLRLPVARKKPLSMSMK